MAEVHTDYPHEPGRLYDCPACEGSCHCKPGETECVFEGEHVEPLFVPLTDDWWVPTEDPKYYRMAEDCTEDCHHPVHAFHPERRRHLEKADWIRENAEGHEARQAAL